MNSAESIEILYKSINKIMGPIEAKKTVTRVLFIVIDDLQEEGLPVTEALISERIAKYANDFYEVTQNEVA